MICSPCDEWEQHDALYSNWEPRVESGSNRSLRSPGLARHPIRENIPVRVGEQHTDRPQRRRSEAFLDIYGVNSGEAGVSLLHFLK